MAFTSNDPLRRIPDSPPPRLTWLAFEIWAAICVAALAMALWPGDLNSGLVGATWYACVLLVWPLLLLLLTAGMIRHPGNLILAGGAGLFCFVVLMIGSAMALGGAFESLGRVSRVQSPSKTFVAVSGERSGNATLPLTSYVYLEPSGSPDLTNPVFTAVRVEGLQVSWVGPRRLRVTAAHSEEVWTKPTARVGWAFGPKVEIEYDVHEGPRR